MRDSAKWLIGCRFCQTVLQVLAGMLVARYLGPTDYGWLGYAASVATFAIPVAQLGLPATLVQEYGEAPEEEGAILGTALVCQLAAGLACIPAVVLFSLAADLESREGVVVCLLYSTALVFQAGETVQMWFHARNRAMTGAVAVMLAGLAASGYKLWLIAAGKGLGWFALSHSVEYALMGVLLLMAYRRYGGKRLRFSWAMAGKLLGKSRYYIAAGVLLVVFQNADHVMLTILAGERENGFYTASLTCAGGAGFFYNGILDAARPEILAAARQSEGLLEERLVQLYRFFMGMTLVQSVAVTVLAEPVISLLYGRAYAPAVPVLRLQVWYLGFGYLGSVRNLWILAAGKHRCLWVVNLTMAVGNIAMNGWLIPRWGAVGAAAASVLTQILGNFLLGFVWKPLRGNQVLLMRALGMGRKHDGNH